MRGSESLALVVSRIHRSRTLNELQQVFLDDVPRLVDGDAFGMYLLGDNLQTWQVVSYHANHRFLSEYEDLRASDPLFNDILQRKQFTHSLNIFSDAEWLEQPLHGFLSRWGLAYSIESPLVIDGRVIGTLNIARGSRRYFPPQSLAAARFVCNEINTACQHIMELETLRRQADWLQSSDTELGSLPDRAREVAELAMSGLTNAAIAWQLRISENTVRYHLKRIYNLLDVHNRAQLQIRCRGRS